MNYRKIGTRIKQFFQFDWVHRNRKKSKIIGDLKKCKRIFYKDTFYDISTSSFIKEDIDIKDGIRLLLLENIVGHGRKSSKKLVIRILSIYL